MTFWSNLHYVKVQWEHFFSKNIIHNQQLQQFLLSVTWLGVNLDFRMPSKLTGKIPVLWNPDCMFAMDIACFQAGHITSKNWPLPKKDPWLSKFHSLRSFCQFLLELSKWGWVKCLHNVTSVGRNCHNMYIIFPHFIKKWEIVHMGLVRIYKQNVRPVKKFVGVQIPYKMNSIFMKFCLGYIPLSCGSDTNTNWCFTCPVLLYTLTTVNNHWWTYQTDSIDKCQNGRCFTLFTTDLGYSWCTFFTNYHLLLWHILYPCLISRPYLIWRSYTQVFKHFTVLFKPFFDIRLICTLCSCSGQIDWFVHFNICIAPKKKFGPFVTSFFGFVAEPFYFIHVWILPGQFSDFSYGKGEASLLKLYNHIDKVSLIFWNIMFFTLYLLVEEFSVEKVFTWTNG